METEQVQKYYYHWIPKGEEISNEKALTEQQASQKEPWVIGIIDSSGSMSSWWNHVAKNYNDLIDSLSTKKVITYCFSDRIYPEPKNRLSNSIHDYGASMTNIVLAMNQLQTEIAKIPDSEEIKVVFVSDGHDTCNGGQL